MTNIDDLPVLTNDFESLTETMIAWMNNNVKVRRWTNQRIDRDFAKRSVSKILEQGDVFYMNPCLDYSLVLVQSLNQNKIKNYILCEEEQQTNFPFHQLHFAIQIDLDSKVYFIDFNGSTIVYAGEGIYSNPRSDIELLKSFRINSNKIKPGKNIFDIITEFDFLNFDFNKQVAKLKNDNTDETYMIYSNSLENDLSLKLKYLD